MHVPNVLNEIYAPSTIITLSVSQRNLVQIRLTSASNYSEHLHAKSTCGVCYEERNEYTRN